MSQGFPTNAPDVYNASELTTEVKDAAFTAAAARRYFIEHATPATRTDATLPAAPTTGDVIEFVGGANTGLFRVIANTGQTIKFLGSTSGTAGYWTAVSIYSMLRVRYVGSNVWEVIGSLGQFDSDGGVRQGPNDSLQPLRIGVPVAGGDAVRLTDIGGSPLVHDYVMSAPFDQTWIGGVEGGFPVLDETTGIVYFVGKSGAATPDILVRKKPASGDRAWATHDSQSAVSLSSAGIGCKSYDFFSDNQNQLLVAGSSVPSVIAYKSTNGGGAWTRTTTTTGFTGGPTVDAVFCYNGLIAYLVAQAAATSKFRKTTDGGVTWGAEVNLATDVGTVSQGTADIASIDNTNIFYVYASSGGTLRCVASSNGGTSFGSPVTIHTGTILTDSVRMGIASDGTIWVCFIVGATGYIYKSTNNGANWTQVKTYPALTSSLTMSCLGIDGTTVYVAFGMLVSTQNAILLISEDGGTTWESQQYIPAYAVTQGAGDDAQIRRLAIKGDELYSGLSDGSNTYVLGFRKL